jgi:hypothetical protein
MIASNEASHPPIIGLAYDDDATLFAKIKNEA